MNKKFIAAYWMKSPSPEFDNEDDYVSSWDQPLQIKENQMHEMR